ncbi:hypothetical protein BaRGS_00014183 [Batillaria attramentaria]|uniref:Uncharacterized protein n=1 Tax=Batillaria attramentaria TaxID=370345 RepID=A0ABD0L5U1_9CAEN
MRDPRATRRSTSAQARGARQTPEYSTKPSYCIPPEREDNTRHEKRGLVLFIIAHVRRARTDGSPSPQAGLTVAGRDESSICPHSSVAQLS